jgi:hypothetical protein
LWTRGPPQRDTLAKHAQATVASFWAGDAHLPARLAGCPAPAAEQGFRGEEGKGRRRGGSPEARCWTRWWQKGQAVVIRGSEAQAGCREDDLGGGA